MVATMSSQEICRDAALAAPAEAKPAGGKQSAHYDFSFAFCNEQFSDCVLRIICEGSSSDQQSSDEEESLVEEVPVSTIILVAKSFFFRKMFTGSFREGGGNNSVEVRIAKEEKPYFMDLLQFIYTGSLPKEASQSFQRALQLLILGDRFDTPDCVADCSAVLMSYVAKLESSDALLLLSLPEYLQQLPNLGGIMEAAKTSLVKEFGSMFCNPSDSSFLQLPEAAVQVLLEADNLKLSSEDVIVRAAMAWVCHHYSEPADRTNALLRIVLPNVRFQSLSPKQVLQVCSFLKSPGDWSISNFMTSDPHSSLKDTLTTSSSASNGGTASNSSSNSNSNSASSNHASSNSTAVNSSPGASSMNSGSTASSAVSNNPPSPGDSLGKQFTELTPSDSVEDQSQTKDPKLSSSRDSEPGHSDGAPSEDTVEGDAAPLSGENGEQAQEQGLEVAGTLAGQVDALTSALVAVSEYSLMHGGTIPRGATLQSCLTGRTRFGPRTSCRPPCSIYLDIPEKLCRDWQNSNDQLATSAPTCASGRWFTLQAKIYVSESTLHVQLSCDKKSAGGEFSSFQIELQLCLQTADSKPAYLQQTRKALCKYTSASASFGCRDFLGKPLAAALEQPNLYFPDGALRLRADVWLVGEGETS